jgi:hypothetical protein
MWNLFEDVAWWMADVVARLRVSLLERGRRRLASVIIVWSLWYRTSHRNSVWPSIYTHPVQPTAAQTEVRGFAGFRL